MNLNEASETLEILLDADTPAMLWGAVGIGKSSIVKQVAKKREQKVIDFRASTRDPVALMGLPDITGDTSRWKVPDEFPKVERDGAEGILLLDEINAAAPSMQAACFGFVLDRQVGEYKLPEGWRIVAAGNRQSDRAAAQRMPSALANRFAHIDVEPDVKTTTDHFNEIDLSPVVTAFLRFRPELLHKPGNGDARSFPTPRSWEQAAKFIDAPEKLRFGLLAGNVGEAAAGELEGFIRTYRNLPSIELVLANPNSAPVPEKPDARFAISSALARRVTETTIANACAYMKRLPREFTISFMVDAVRRRSGLSHTDAFVQWSTENQDVVFG
jgi:hypothetical protein